MASNPDFKKIATTLVKGEPLAFKPYPDGSLVVIAPNGQKCTFTPQQINTVTEQPKTQSQPPAKAAQKPAKPPKKTTGKK